MPDDIALALSDSVELGEVFRGEFGVNGAGTRCGSSGVDGLVGA
jgi:hypothetical protein